MKQKTFVLGDLHGGHKALLQVLKAANFDYKNDKLISLGDIADGWTEVKECFEELSKIKNLVIVRGNHDQWLLDWFNTGAEPDIWVMQGGRNTLKSYAALGEITGRKIKYSHQRLLEATPFWHVEGDKLFVHGGYADGVPLEAQLPENLMWSRDFKFNRDLCNRIKDYEEVYVGHSTVWQESEVPLTIGKVTFMDTGGGYEGKLSLMNIDTKEVFQSDIVRDLYPDVHPR